MLAPVHQDTLMIQLIYANLAVINVVHVLVQLLHVQHAQQVLIDQVLLLVTVLPNIMMMALMLTVHLVTIRVLRVLMGFHVLLVILRKKGRIVVLLVYAPVLLDITIQELHNYVQLAMQHA